MSDDLLRVYLDPADFDEDGNGYPRQWVSETIDGPRIPDWVREQAGHRCVRCRHPFVVGITPGRWSPCDDQCVHGGPLAADALGIVRYTHPDATPDLVIDTDGTCFAEYRVLTVHHLNGVKYDCRWWNLVALCQRCHLTIQSKVHLERPWNREHSEWFKPYVAGFYASHYGGVELTREQTMARLDEILEEQLTQRGLW